MVRPFLSTQALCCPDLYVYVCWKCFEDELFKGKRKEAFGIKEFSRARIFR
jgi:hypothetical protein